MLGGMQDWVEQIRAGQMRAIARALTAIENRAPEAEPLLRALFPYTGGAYMVGVTGAPGTGKSTLVDRLAAHYRRQGLTVGVLAVDPSSPFTGGAILGDRIRMQTQASDSGLFIRSMATRGWLGGLAQATAEAALVLDAAGKQIILIETVGVGQDEIEVARLADCTLLVLVPGLGDDVQNLKAGVMEIADIFVVNKADREGADRLESQLRALLALAEAHRGWRPPVVRTVAIEDRGTAELAGAIEQFRQQTDSAGRRGARRVAYWKQRIVELVERRLRQRVEQELVPERLEELARAVAARELDPYAAADALLARAEAR
jgi:LAO/AO transport system kinase